MACQVEKLKRLMEGTDLDPGEHQIYTTPSEYPNVIILEGGMNDTLDSDAVEETYYGQFIKMVTDVYRKEPGQPSAEIGNAYIQTPSGEVNRTCFAGAYRHIAEELQTLFPKAQIFITTVSGLGYWYYDVTQLRYKQAVQQRKCANLLGFGVIDWSAEGQINSVVNFPSGNGTENDPYILNAQTIQTSDLMHPNVSAAKRYGRLAAMVIRTRFLNFETE
jgi:lysophospholipase L1-like esterase